MRTGAHAGTLESDASGTSVIHASVELNVATALVRTGFLGSDLWILRVLLTIDGKDNRS
jgi:hypothetical protein